MDIYLIRHTKTQAVDGLCYGQSDIGLAESFHEEARCLHERLPELSDDCRVITSPLTRCCQLAQTFAKPVTTDERISEINFGDWENRRFDEIETELVKIWSENFMFMSPPGGESFHDLCCRVEQFWQELLENKPAEEVLLVTHSGVIRALLTSILQLPPANALQLKVDTGSIHKLSHSNDYTHVQYLNQ